MQLAREEYPLTHYPMYSRPSAEPNGYFYLTDADGRPLPVTWHTGMTPSRIGKQFLTVRLDYVREHERRTGLRGRDLPGDILAALDERAGRETLLFLRELARQRSTNPVRHLNEAMTLMEGRLRRGPDGLEETARVVATIEAGAEGAAPGS